MRTTLDRHTRLSKDCEQCLSRDAVSRAVATGTKQEEGTAMDAGSART